jgi:cardiolipin synthase
MDATFRAAWDWWLVLWPHLAAWGIIALSAVASAHAILVKRDTRSTIGWVGLIWLSPVIGALA